MTRQTRYFMLGSGAVLVAGLAVGVVAYYGGFPGLAFQANAPAELRYVPEDAVIVGYADVQEVMRSDFRQKVRSLEPGEAKHGQQEFKDQTGIDIETDIISVLAFIRPGDESEGMVLARGHFDEARIQSFLVSKGASVEQYQGARILSGPHEAGKKGAVAFLEPGLVAVGSAAAVKGAIDRSKAGAGDILDNPEMLDLINKVRTDGNAWAVGRFDALAGQAKLPADVMSRIPPMNSFAAAGRINGGISGHLSIEAKSEEAAKNLTQVVDGFVALARLHLGSNPEQARLFDQLNLTTQGRNNTVDISFSVSPELFDALQAIGKR
ncbi:MAG: DUF3352 domain-containing protein [Vicinamibacterales bacterium]